jgi:N6-L-threonylcarbamoyladenine synthase
MLLLAIETTCDETAAAVITRDRVVLSSVVASQDELHARWRGVVPEVASRAHVERIIPVIDEAVSRAGINRGDLAAVAVAVRPGLVGSLLVGLSAAKGIAASLGIPIIGYDHIAAHLYACHLAHPQANVYPCVGLVASGGHTSLFHARSPLELERLGGTIDDAAGEAFDKVARFLGLGYPGGPAIDREAMHGDPEAIRFPRSMIDEGLDFSFSGLKTSVVNHVRKHPDVSTEDVAASFQAAVVDVLVAKARRAAAEVGATALAIGGGVAANSLLREQFLGACATDGLHGFLPSRAMCTDNAAMIASAGWYRLAMDGPTPLDRGADPNLRLPTLR